MAYDAIATASRSPPSVAKQKKLKQARNSAAAAKQVEQKLRFLRQTKPTPELEAQATISCNKLIAAEARQGHLDRVEKVLDDMKRHHLKPDIYTYNGLIHASVKANNARAAKKWLTILENHGQVQPDVTSYNTILSLYCKSNKLTEALQLFDDVKQRQLADRVTYNTLFGMLLRQSDAECQRGIDILAAVDPAKTQVDGTTVAYVMKFHLKLKQPAEALSLFSELPKYNLELCSQTTNAAMLTYMSIDNIDEARDIFLQLARNTRPDESTCTALVHSFDDDLEACADWMHARRDEGIEFTPCMIGYMLKAVIVNKGSLLAEQFMARLTGGSKLVKVTGFQLDAVVFGILMQAIASEESAPATDEVPASAQQRGQRCSFWLRKMKDMGIEIPLAPLTSYMNALGNDGDAEELMSQFRQWKDKVTYDELMYKTAVSWLSKMGRVEYVNEVLQAMPPQISASRCVGTARQQLPEHLLSELKTRRSPHSSPRTQRRGGQQQQQQGRQHHQHYRGQHKQSQHQRQASHSHHHHQQQHHYQQHYQQQQFQHAHQYAYQHSHQAFMPYVPQAQQVYHPPQWSPGSSPPRTHSNYQQSPPSSMKTPPGLHASPSKPSRADISSNWRRTPTPVKSDFAPPTSP
eukprot:TRINITY_DN10054_c0_g1_i1.p1 TRINITY_DN10054_c0_g1~~TRINITY_DN10054_c0_g1_i1.p1  ORF type:complete len:634 (+),score=167.24 TRINITY_DN10054_c0_g1_i1:162-2063(+)